MIAADAKATGLEVCGDERFECSKDTIVVPGSRWITIYDQSTEAQDGNSLRDLVATSSRLTESFAVSVLVHDSDILSLELFEAGKIVDSYCHNPEQPTRQRGNVQLWKELLIDGASAEDLRKAFDYTSTFAEDTLDRVAQVVGFDKQAVKTGFTYVIGDGVPMSSGSLRLRFGSTGRLCRSPNKPQSSTTVIGETVGIDELRSLTFDIFRWARPVRSRGTHKLLNCHWAPDGKSATLTVDVSTGGERELREKCDESKCSEFIFNVKPHGDLAKWRMHFVVIDGILAGARKEEHNQSVIELQLSILHEPQRAGTWDDVGYYPKHHEY
jgi:hypothetical protein